MDMRPINSTYAHIGHRPSTGLRTYWLWYKTTRKGIHIAITMGQQPKGYSAWTHRNAKSYDGVIKILSYEAGIFEQAHDPTLAGVQAKF